jgi:hypothetical protein
MRTLREWVELVATAAGMLVLAWICVATVLEWRAAAIDYLERRRGSDDD